MRAVLAREAGTILKTHRGRLRVALAFPNTYNVGMSNLGFQAAYRLFNERDDVVCERVFMPPRQEVQERLRTGARLVTLETQTPVSDFDVVAFSVSFEWDYPNVAAMLRMSGIPTRSRGRNARHPLVVLGGAVSFLNPEPLAPLFDVVAVGEGEILVPSLLDDLSSAQDRSSLLSRLSLRDGMYVPSLLEPEYDGRGSLQRVVALPGWQGRLPVRKAVLKKAEMGDPPATVVFTPDTEFGSRLLIEAVRGCANMCRFCWAGYSYLPVRPFEADRILRLATEARRLSSSVGLVSIALCDHPEIERILESLHEMGYRISPASLRLDELTAPMLRLLRASGERSITIAPESGSDRLRRVINKAITNEEILERVDLALANGIENLKLYFMIGLPTEEDEDLVAIRDLTAAIRERLVRNGRSRGAAGRVSASVNPLVPKPGTAYQWSAMERPSVSERKMKRLRRLVAGLDNVHFSFKSERQSYFQAMLSLGDRRVASVIEAVAENGGQWRSAADAAGVDPDWYVFRDRSTDTFLPWQIIDCGVPEPFLRSEFSRGLAATVTPP
jgi:radical SAM superfamily enzyme YgiQ (UPF0313 family)